MAIAIKYFYGFIGVIICLYVLQLIFWFFYLGFWDMRVEQMCLDDGGVVIHQTINLSEEEARALGLFDGTFSAPPDTFPSSEGRPVLQRVETTVLKSGTPTIRKFETTLYRVSDDQDLGTLTSYGRSGSGAILTFIETSSFGCSAVEGMSLDLEQQIFRLN